MDQGQKPFACTISGCEMTFTNEDHLNCHQKKHDMVLHFGLASKNESSEMADQTPTPTRFIRNCEEVGLFQDLQNVNPFDETFKKAIEGAKEGSLQIFTIPASSDDTLHTPHFFPPIIEKPHNFVAKTYTAVTISSEEDNDSNDSFPLTIVTDAAKTNCENSKQRLKEAIQNKSNGQSKKRPLEAPKLPLDTRPPPPDAKKEPGNREKVREINRAAQIRCRKRKQQLWRAMQDENRTLKSDNAKLVQENQHFRQKFYDLKELFVKHKNHHNLPFLNEVENVLHSATNAEIAPIGRKLVPKTVIKTTNSNIAPKSDSVFIQVVGSVSQVAVSLLPKKTQ